MEDLDYEQPRALWEKVFDAGAKDRFVEVSLTIPLSLFLSFFEPTRTDASFNLLFLNKRTSLDTSAVLLDLRLLRGSLRSSRGFRLSWERG